MIAISKWLLGVRFTLNSFIPYESMTLHVFGQIQPLLFMTVCAPIRKALVCGICTAFSFVGRPLFFSKHLSLQEFDHGTPKTMKPSQNIAQLVAIIASLICSLFLSCGVPLAYLQINYILDSQIIVRESQNSLRLVRFSVVTSHSEIPILDWRDNKLECYLNGGYPNEIINKCFHVFPTPAVLGESFFDLHEGVCSNMSMVFYYPITLQQSHSVDAILKTYTGHQVAPLIHVGYIFRDERAFGRFIYESYDYDVILEAGSPLWVRRTDGSADVACQIGGRIVQCNSAQKTEFFVCSHDI